LENELKYKLWAVGGGKGGVGKSIVTLLLGTILARKGKKVVLVDADLGGSNLHTLCGIKYPIYTLADFIKRKADNIEDVIMLTPIKNLELICGADDILGVANPKSTQKERIFKHLNKIDADIILFDLGAGTSFTTMDFFLYAPNKIVVLTPQITSIQNAYGFIKSSLYRLLVRRFGRDDDCYEIIKQLTSPGEDECIDSVIELKTAFEGLGEQYYANLLMCLEELNLGIIVNMVRNRNESNVGNVVKDVANNYLGLSPEYLGFVNYDRMLESSINNMKDYLIKAIDNLAGSCIDDIASNILIKNSNPESAIANAAYLQTKGCQ